MNRFGKTRRHFRLVLMLGGFAALLVPGAAAARPKAALSFSLTGAVSEGNPIPYSWSARHIGKNSRLVVQRPVGTAHVWKTVTRLPGRTGSGELPGVGLGRYRYRLAALRGRRVLAQQVAKVSVFGVVPFSTLFEGFETTPGVVTTASTSFSYIDWTEPGHPSPNPSFTVQHNNCISVHIGFLPYYPRVPSYYDKSTVSGTVAVVQESQDPVSATAPYEGLDSVDATLIPGQSWGMVSSYDGEFEPLIYFNGYAICNSRESFFGD